MYTPRASWSLFVKTTTGIKMTMIIDINDASLLVSQSILRRPGRQVKQKTPASNDHTCDTCSKRLWASTNLLYTDNNDTSLTRHQWILCDCLLIVKGHMLPTIIHTARQVKDDEHLQTSLTKNRACLYDYTHTAFRSISSSSSSLRCTHRSSSISPFIPVNTVSPSYRPLTEGYSTTGPRRNNNLL